jgi:hypothetical protein
MILRNMKKDMSGISTILIVIIIVVILVAAAGAAYIVLSADNENKEKTPEETGPKTIAPGTVMVYDLSQTGKLYGETYNPEFNYTVTLVGQSDSIYFVKLWINDDDDAFWYSTEIKTAPEGAKISNIEMETIHGLMELEKWEYTEKFTGETKFNFYLDPSTGIRYEIETSYRLDKNTWWDVNEVLRSITPKWQDSYEQSSSIGKNAYEYTTIFSMIPYKVTIECVADCQNNKFGVSYSYSIDDFKEYFLCDTPQGLPAGSVKKGVGILTETIDDQVTVDIWEYTHLGSGAKTIFYVGQTSKIIYEIQDEYTDEIFVLTKKL